MRYFLIAGEASGDLHASLLITALKDIDCKAEFCFLGGDEMASASGISPEVHYKNMAYMGFIEVIKHIGEILGIMKKARHAIDVFHPDAIILIDYPSFNLKMAKYAKSKGIPVFYYISPKVWAWKEYRVKSIRKYVDKLYSILPFEVPFYRKHNYQIEYVGNPSVKEVDEKLKSVPDFIKFCEKYSLDPNKPIIALLPGSRLKEIDNNLSEMLHATKPFDECQVVIAGAPAIDLSFYKSVLSPDLDLPTIVVNDTYALLKNSRGALVTSGTATLETALVGTPQVACYRMSGKKWVFTLFSHILKIKYVTLPNLIADKMVIPELLLHLCNSENMAAHLGPLLCESREREEMLSGYNDIRQKLGNGDSAVNAASSMYKFINNRHDQKYI